MSEQIKPDLAFNAQDEGVKMKINIEAHSIPKDAKTEATIGILMYIDPADGHTHIAVPFEISPTAKRENVLMIHQIMQGFDKFFPECKSKAKAEFEQECETADLLGEEVAK